MTTCRPADLAPGSDERQFVISSWSSSYKNSHFAGIFDSEDWPEFMHRTVNRILDRPNTRTLVAVAPGAFVYGFIAGDTSRRMPIVHYVYVKDAFRSHPVDVDASNPLGNAPREGPRIARALFAALGVDPGRPFLFTCRTPIVAELNDRVHGTSKIPRGKFCPAAARYANYEGV